MQHAGCPYFDLDVTGKTPVSVLNEYAMRVLRCPIEFVVTTQEDPVNPYLTAIVCDGIVIARGAYINKKMSRQVASRKALSILAPLLDLSGTSVVDNVVANVVDTGGGVVGGVGATLESMEAKEVETLRLKLSDDRILDNTIGKTPVMVLQEHCHKHVGKLPEYLDAVETPGKLPVYRVTVTLFSGERCSAVDVIKKKAKQRCALTLLRQLYPHVELWGDLVESTNSRLKEERAAKIKARREGPASAAAAAAAVVQQQEQQAQAASAGGGDASAGVASIELPSPTVIFGIACANAATSANPPAQPPVDDDTLGPHIPFDKLTRKQLDATKTRIWERIATLNNRAGGRQVISISTEPVPLKARKEDE